MRKLGAQISALNFVFLGMLKLGAQISSLFFLRLWAAYLGTTSNGISIKIGRGGIGVWVRKVMEFQ